MGTAYLFQLCLMLVFLAVIHSYYAGKKAYSLTWALQYINLFMINTGFIILAGSALKVNIKLRKIGLMSLWNITHVNHRKLTDISKLSQTFYFVLHFICRLSMFFSGMIIR